MRRLAWPITKMSLPAAVRIALYATVTPVLRLRVLDAPSGAELHFKAEHLHVRRVQACRRLQCGLVAGRRCRGARSGHPFLRATMAAALALAAPAEGIPCHVVVPEGAVAAKLANIARHGATLWRCEATAAAREAACAEVQASTGRHPGPSLRRRRGDCGARARPRSSCAARSRPCRCDGGAGGRRWLVRGHGAGAVRLAPGCALVLEEPAGAADAARSLGSGVRDVGFVPDTICDGLRASIGIPNFELLCAQGLKSSPPTTARW